MSKKKKKDFPLGVLSLLFPALFLTTLPLILYTHHPLPPNTQAVISFSRFYSYSTLFTWLPFTYSSEPHMKCLLPGEGFLDNSRPLLADSIPRCTYAFFITSQVYYWLGLFPSIILATLWAGIYFISQSSTW